VRDALEQNAPNPFNPQTVIGYSVSQPGRVEIRIFGAGGALVRRFVEHRAAAGRYAVRWNGTDDSGRRLGSGVYFYEIETQGGYRAARKLLLLK
jgi:flagellar hook assembly protein FlgD